jgi:hypothetical protein
MQQQEEEIDWKKELYGRGYARIDWERDQRKKRDFWAALDGGSSGEALMVDWHWIFGSAVDVIRPFLKLTGEKTESFPCPADTPCECRHAIGETLRGELIATCGCGHSHCRTYQIEPEDILFHGIDFDCFGDSIRQALGFAKPGSAAYVSAGLREIGTYAAAAVPVYLSLEESDGLVRELAKLLELRDGPFLVLTPTGGSWSAEVEALARPHAGGHIALSSVLSASVDGFTSNGAIEPMLANFARRLGKGNGMVAMVERIEGNMEVIAKNTAELKRENAELRTAKQRLEKMLADGMFAFTRKVDAKSFKILCTILAEGDVAKAARRLGMGDPLMRYTLRQWRELGGAYAVMLDLVRWRKKVGRREELPLNDAILNERAETADYPAMLSDVLDGLLAMTDLNWQERCEELAELIRPALSTRL